MPLNRRVGPNEERSFARSAAPYTFRFLGANPVSGIVQDEGLIASIARTAAGTYLVTFRSRFMRLMPVPPSVRLTGNWDVKVLALVEGGAAVNTMTIECNNIGTGIADPNQLIDCAVRLVVSPGD